MSPPINQAEKGVGVSRQSVQRTITTATTSICPVCKSIIPANIYRADGKVYMKKTCSIHGDTVALISSDAKLYDESFVEWSPQKENVFSL